MPICRATMLFSSTNNVERQAGWSESWYQDGTPTSVMSNLRALGPSRMAFMPSFSFIIGQRVQVIGARAFTDNTQFSGGGRISVDVPQMAAQCSVQNADRSKKKIFSVRGIADTPVDTGALTMNSPTAQGLNLFMRQLGTLAFQWRARDLSLPTIQIVSVAADGTFLLAGDLDYAVGDFLTAVRIRSQQGRSVVGSFYVSVRTDARNGKFHGWPAGQTVSLSGKLRKQAFVYPIVEGTGSKVERVMVRKVGRPFFPYRGRATRRR